jgi:hypothetical protein
MNTVNPTRKHQREVWLRIIAPVVLPFIGLIVLGVILIVAVATHVMVSKQITVIMSLLATAFIALPMAILCLVPYFLLAVSAYGAGRVHANAQKPLRAVRRITGQIAEKTNRYFPRIAGPVISINVQIARWEQAFRSWQQSSPSSEEEKIDE